MDLSVFQNIILVLAILITILFTAKLRIGQQVTVVHKCYYFVSALLLIWMLCCIAMGMTSPEKINLLMALEAATTVCGAFIPASLLLFVLCYTKEYMDRMPKRILTVYIVPAITAVMISTNSLHHLYYKVFGLAVEDLEFGPYFLVHSFYSYACVAVAVVIIFLYAFKTKSRLHMRQAFLFTAGGLVPSIVNVLAILGVFKSSIILTPISFAITLAFHSFVIYRLNFFDIRPIAMEHLLNWISDCYLVTSTNGFVVNYNERFVKLFGESYNIRENVCLYDRVSDEDVENKTPIYNLLAALRSCEQLKSRVTYEQAVDIMENGDSHRYWYMVEVTPVFVKDNVGGYVSIFKDMSLVKQNMQQIANQQMRMMENDRLAFLGQMVGGLAHNLKTPIMSISGSLLALEKLIVECQESIGDPEVVADDYREIYGEMTQWLSRMQEAGTYMSDIINAVKGQAQNMGTSAEAEFSLDEALRRVQLLLRHELQAAGCILKVTPVIASNGVLVQGDINNMVQVVNNLVSNAIDAQKPNGKREIEVDAFWDDKEFCFTVKDYGTGLPENSKKNLFHHMVTSKGTKGTGLGVFISNSVIHAKFEGSMWYEDNPEGGTIMGIRLPMNYISFEKEVEAHA